ncbi:undecaprenyl-phosphate glucose phosphotransferase [Colwellia sp. TT2012]|uniref:undecaprenyl-phosphate glucose phosphotransferase n=1 Tax=Colwellia sp. TT2012 TaxID=1720342 RepID=UPI00070CF548|nr:undecaprenyl-phosphate glucose phosphotransferase [Colwellia sp. TT2012]
MVKSTGLIRSSANTFAIFYRLVDFIIIQAVLVLSLLGYGLAYSQQYFVIALIASLAFFLASESFALYRSWRAGSFKEIMFYCFISWAISAIAVLIFLVFSKISEDFSRITLAIWFVFTFISLVTWRYIFALFLAYIRKKGHNTRSIAILGLTASTRALVSEILQQPETGFRVAAIFEDREKDRVDSTYHHLLEGTIADGVERAKNNEFDKVYIGLPTIAQERLSKILHQLGNTTANVELVPDKFMHSIINASINHVGEIQTVSIFENPMQGAATILKRIEDLVLSTIILLLIAIPMLVIAVAIKRTSRGPVLFKQDRYGLDGKKIKVWKFRSMTVAENGAKVVQATKGDARITPLGAFLRRTSLDELPQFFNVLKGDMSVVGPRPHAVAHNEQYRKEISFYMLRHKVKPGITGWAQVNGWRGETDTLEKMEMRIKFDIEYMRRWSLWFDFKIVLFTIFRSFNDKNAY